MMGLKRGSYEAYCFDQAVWYLGVTIQNEIDQAGQKKDSKQAAIEAARQRVLKKFLDGHEAKGQYADPAALFTAQMN